jgi:hypothetical protein
MSAAVEKLELTLIWTAAAFFRPSVTSARSLGIARCRDWPTVCRVALMVLIDRARGFDNRTQPA